jgi:hypothetical protein
MKCRYGSPALLDPVFDAAAISSVSTCARIEIGEDTG